MEYLIHIAILFSIYAILGLSLNLVVGYTGSLSLAHAAFYGIGAYATAILMTVYNFNFFSSMGVGIVLASLSAFFVGSVLARFKDDIYALASLGFTVIVFSLFLNWQEVTRGPLGIPGIGKPTFFGFEFDSNFLFMLFSVLVLIVVVALIRFLVNSSFGRVIMAIREDPEALGVFGYRVDRFRLAVFVIGAGIASVAGSLFASYISFIDPSSFNINETIFIIAIVILGGLASIRGSVFGALFLILLPEVLRFVGFPSEIAAQMRQVTYGLILILLMLYRPQGVFGTFRM